MGRRPGQNRVNARELVLDGLLTIEREQEYSHVVTGGILDKYNYLEAREKAFIKRLIEGTLERRITLDYAIDSVSSVPVRRMKPLIRELMRMSGIRSCLWMRYRTAPYAMRRSGWHSRGDFVR